MKSWRYILCAAVLLVGISHNIPKANTPAIPYESKPAETFPEVLLKIAACESGGEQFNPDGSVVEHHNKNGTTDYGYLQINSVHLKEAEKMSMDIMTFEGNKAFGKWLYEKQGTTPWNWSAWCWK